MTKPHNTREDNLLGFDSDITRRDFIGSAMIGAGAGLLYAQAPGLMRNANAQTLAVPLTGVGPDWTGPGGIGDYRNANGNTHEVMNDGHGIRNGAFEKMFKDAVDSGELYDLVVVGGGFAGLSAAYRYHEDRPNASVLIMDNHAIFGGEAKQNEFEVDGVHTDRRATLDHRRRRRRARGGASTGDVIGQVFSRHCYSICQKPASRNYAGVWDARFRMPGSQDGGPQAYRDVFIAFLKRVCQTRLTA